MTKENTYIVEVKDLQVYFDIDKRKFAKKGRKVVRAVDGVSFGIREGEILSLVGESGSGKTTTGKAILNLASATGGEVLFEGRPLDQSKTGLKAFRKEAQMVFQDPYQSLNPRNRIIDLVAEPLDVNLLAGSPEERLAKVKQALEQAGLSPAEEYLYRYPYELSGGQRQRVVIAGAIIMEPKFVVADEPISMLDASVRTGILKLLLGLRDEKGLSYLFITHDLSLAWLISDRIAIMYLGQIMEIGSADQIIKGGVHPYTKALTAIMPIPGVNKNRKRDVLQGETPNASIEITGCKFASRCPAASQECFETQPILEEIEAGHFAACLKCGRQSL